MKAKDIKVGSDYCYFEGMGMREKRYSLRYGTRVRVLAGPQDIEVPNRASIRRRAVKQTRGFLIADVHKATGEIRGGTTRGVRSQALHMEWQERCGLLAQQGRADTAATRRKAALAKEREPVWARLKVHGHTSLSFRNWPWAKIERVADALDLLAAREAETKT